MQLADRGSDYSTLDLELYGRYAAHIYVYVYRLVSHTQDAKDITLEVFLVAYKSRKQLAGLDAQKQLAWLQRVAHNKVVDRYRRSSRVMLLPLEHIEKQRD